MPACRSFRHGHPNVCAFVPSTQLASCRRAAHRCHPGAGRAPTVTTILRITGLAHERRFVNYHRVLNRAAWCPRAASRILLGPLIAALAPSGPVVLGIEDIIERQRGKRIAAKGIYRDPVRSSHGHFVRPGCGVASRGSMTCGRSDAAAGRTA